MKKEIILCNKLCQYELYRKKVRNLNLHIKPDGCIYVSAPKSVPVSEIEAFIKKNEFRICSIIERQKDSAKEYPIPEEYKDDEEFLYLGEIMKMKLLKAQKNSFKLEGEYLFLCLKEPENKEAAEKLFECFIKAESENILLDICKSYYPAFCPPLKSFPEIKFRKMRSRWGSCTPGKNLLCFNSCLSCLPRECIEYVAAHEFTHFIHANHSKNFYGELSRFMPDQREREKKLKEYSALPRRFCI